jgi:hypothetical protein
MRPTAKDNARIIAGAVTAIVMTAMLLVFALAFLLAR